MLPCTVCGTPFWPSGRWRHEWCHDCFARNFAEAQPPLIVHAPDPSVQALTPRQVQALRRAAERWAQEDE